MNNVPSNMRFYRYSVASLDLILPDSEKPISIDPKHVTGLFIERDYDDDFFPVIRLSVVLDPKLYHRIVKNKLSVKFRLRLQKFIFDKNKEIKFKRDVFNDVFCVFLDENTPFLEEKQFDETKETDGTNKTPRDMGQDYDFFLFKENELMNSKKRVNTIISNSTLTDAVTYCLATTGFNNVLMSPLNNKAKYSEILVPPLTLLGSLLYLEQQYGFYETGALIFFDIDCNYIIDSSPKCTAFRTQEYIQTVFTVREYTNADVFTPGCFVDDKDKKYFINITPTNVQMFNDSVIADQIDGNNLIIVHPASGDVQTINPKTVQRGSGTYKLLVNKYDNKFSNSRARTRKSEDSNIMTVTIGDYDIDALSPNKEFTFVFENSAINKKFNGNYRLSKTLTSFVKQGNEFAISTNCQFKKFDR